MAYVLLGILVLALLASVVAAYLGTGTWPIYQVVLAVFVFLGAVVFFYLGARTLATHRAWRNLVEQRKSELAQLKSQTVPLVGGADAAGQNVPGKIPQLQHELALLTSRRGGVYYDVTAESIKDGVVQLTLAAAAPAKPPNAGEPAPEQPAPGEAAPAAPEKPAAEPNAVEPLAHGLAADTIVYAFDQKPFSEGGRYLGEFKVVAAPEGSPAVQVAPTLPLTEAQAKRLAAAVKGTWTLYTTMPPDDASVFAGMDEAARKALLPADSAAEFAKADRPLRDYQTFFHENYVQRSLLADAIAKTTGKIERTTAATEEVKKEIAYRDNEKTGLGSDLEKFRFEVKAITAYEEAVKSELARVRQELRETYIENRKAAAALQLDQFQATDEINRPAAR
jgi:hypothetical protein